VSTVKCISPIDGSVFAERPCLSEAQAFACAARARAAQAKAWASLKQGRSANTEPSIGEIHFTVLTRYSFHNC
jgi:acyl-CoA reductase-like NAD-dependent aldehyde dehydrogenase